MRIKLFLIAILFLTFLHRTYSQTLTYDNFKSGIIQWQCSEDSSTWQNIPNANEPEYLLTSEVKPYYRAMILDGSCNGQPIYSDIYKYPYNILSKSTLSFKLPPNTNKENIKIGFAPLKYNKRFAIGTTSDDQGIVAWNRLLPYFNQGWIDDLQYFHSNMTRTTGAYTSRSLTYTDGCGVIRRFSINTANCYNLRGEYWEYPMNKQSPNNNWIYLVWDDQYIINDFDGACSFHDVQAPNKSEEGGTVNEILSGLEDANDNCIFNALGRKLMVMTEPNGDSLYTKASLLYSGIKMITRQHQDGSGYKYVNLTDSTNFTKLKVARYIKDKGSFEEHKNEITNEIINKSVNGAHFYGEFGLHGLYDGSDIKYTAANIATSAKIETFDWLCDTYGEHGSDELWFATNDEVIQYKYLNSVTPLDYTINGDSLYVHIDVPQIKDFYWYEYTLLIDGINPNSVDNINIDSQKDKIVGMSYGKSDGKMMLNLNYDTTLIKRAEKYTALFENNVANERFTLLSLEHKRNAEYFIQRLLPSLQEPFRNRIGSLAKPPVLSELRINSGMTETSDLDVSIDLEYTGIPMEYRIGEANDLAGCQWQPVSNPISYTLSYTGGIKNIYVQLRNPFGETAIQQASINYIVPELEFKSITINKGAPNTENNNVLINLRYRGLPTHYMLSEDSTFTNVSWKVWDHLPISFTLSSGYGEKAVYAKMKNDSCITPVINNHINYVKQAAVISFAGTTLNTISYPAIDNGTIINLLQIVPNPSYSSQTLKSIGETSLDWAIELENNFYTNNTESNTTGTYLNLINNLQPSLSGNMGVYPDSYLSKNWVLNGHGENNTKKGRIVFTLPNGSYKFKLLMSTSPSGSLTAAQLSKSWYRIDTNGISGIPVNVGTGGFTAENNTTFNAEVNVVVTDGGTKGNAVLYLYNTGGFYYRPGINLIEIVKTD